MERQPLYLELETLGNYFKEKESNVSLILDSKLWTILRVDGHSFSKFTRRFKSKCDERMIKAMCEATSDWMKQWNGTTGYTQSDEAMICIPPSSQLPFNGRVSKIISLSASFFSVRFNFHLPQEFVGTAHFDCRALQVEEKDLYKVFYWRQLDCFRNGASVLARESENKKSDIEACNTKKKIEIIKADEKLVNSDPHLLHGTFLKRMLYTIKPKQEGDEVTRQKIIFIKPDLKETVIKKYSDSFISSKNLLPE